MTMDRPKYGIGYDYAQRETEETNSGQRNAHEAHGNSSEVGTLPCAEKNGRAA
jgi:hypothetical protein